jgi:hypothetical protein
MPEHRVWWRDPIFWLYGVGASLLASAIWAVGGRVLEPALNWIATTRWAGFAEWLHELGWLAFLITVSLWFVRARLLPAHHASHPPRPATSSRAPAVKPSTLVIHKALYGLPGHDIDVADRLRGMVVRGKLDVIVNNQTMGDDPVVGQRKRVIVTYTGKDGQQQHMERSEKDRLTIS